MKFLLDTHIFIWWILDSPKLNNSIKEIVTDKRNELYLSSASTWEMIIKSKIGKLTMPPSPEEFIKKQLYVNAINILDITMNHTFMLASLPMVHKDPFDRILIAQAIYENFSIITTDETIKKYNVNIV